MIYPEQIQHYQYAFLFNFSTGTVDYFKHNSNAVLQLLKCQVVVFLIAYSVEAKETPFNSN